MTEKHLEKQLEEAKKTASEMVGKFNELRAGLNAPELRRTREALDAIDFNNPQSIRNAHKVMGVEMNNIFNNDSRDSK